MHVAPAPLPNLHAAPHKRQRGFTLLELMIVVFILSVTAAVAIPNLSTTDPYKLDKASSELADAIRFARAEAIRIGEPIGVWYFSSTSSFALYRVVYVLGLPVPVYDIRHPVDKKLYSLDYSANGNQAPVKLNSVTLHYGGDTTNREYISFDKHGTPRYLSGSTYQMLDTASIVLGYAGQTRTVNVSPMVGRVSAQ
jgi:prepilin-type N-terminal cleavage/methylation domain-containing protein